jgi:hypothetical protein
MNLNLFKCPFHRDTLLEYDGYGYVCPQCILNAYMYERATTSAAAGAPRDPDPLSEIARYKKFLQDGNLLPPDDEGE